MDCAVRLPSGQVMVCAGPWVIFVDPHTERVTGAPRLASEIFGPSFPAFPEALVIGQGDRSHKLYVFSRGSYWRYDAPTDRTSNRSLDRDYPGSIDAVWYDTRSLHGSSSGPSSAITLPDGRIFFFAGDKCIEHVWGQKSTGTPQPIAQVFPGLPGGADYLVMGGSGALRDHIYAVFGDHAVVYDPARANSALAQTINLADTWTGFRPPIPETRLAALRARARDPLGGNWANVEVAETLGQAAQTLQTPLRVDQGSYPTCGQAAVIFCLAQYFPDLYVQYFVQALGRGGLLGSGEIKGHSRSFRARERTYRERWRPEMDITSNDWVLTALLRDDASQLLRVKTDGAQVRNGITTPNELRFQLKHLLPKTGNAQINRAFSPNTREAALKWAHDARRRGGVAIHLVCGAIIPGGGTSYGPNHWVTHLGGLNISHGGRPLRSFDDRYRMQVQSWGALRQINWRGDVLKSQIRGYYGSVRWIP